MRLLLVVLTASMFCLAAGCNTGTGNKNSEKIISAFERLERNANAGDIPAQIEVGRMYMHGFYVKRDERKGFEYYEKAAAQGDQSAKYNIAYFYETGSGITKDIPKAIKLYTDLVNEGFAQANAALGYIYLNGDGVVQDYNSAFDYFNIASKSGFGLWALGDCYARGIGVAKNRDAAIALYKREAYAGNAFAQRELAQMYYSGKFVSKDYSEARRLFSLAADQGDIVSALALGDIYFGGLGVKKNLDEAALWYKKAAEQGNMPSDIASRYDGLDSSALVPSRLSMVPEKKNVEVQYLWSLVESVDSQSIDVMRPGILSQLNDKQIADVQYTAKRVAPLMYRKLDTDEYSNCFRCHSVDGSVKVGPSFNLMYGRKSVSDASKNVDDAFVVRKLKSTKITSEDKNVGGNNASASMMISFIDDDKVADVVIPFLRALGHSSTK